MDDEAKAWATMWGAIIAALGLTAVGLAVADPIAAACAVTESRSAVCMVAVARGSP